MSQLLIAAVVSSTTSPTSAADTVSAAPAPAFDVNLRVDLPVLAIAGATAFGWILGDELAPAHCLPACDEADVFAVDRVIAGQYQPEWRTVSDVTIASVLALSATTLLVDEGLANGAQDLVVVAQSVLIANGLAVVLQLGAHRPRPLVYSERAPLDVRMRGNSALSFPSGHVAGAFAATMAVFSALERLHPDSAIAYIALAIGATAASFVGVSRMIAGDHFPTDVVAGALLGTGVGLLVPALHDVPALREVPVQVVGGPSGTLGVALAW